MGIGQLIWKISVALYLIVNGIMGIKDGGDFKTIFNVIFGGNQSTLALICGIIALIAGICIVLNMLRIEVSFLPTLVLVVAIVWVVYIVIEILAFVKGGFSLGELQTLAVHLMVLGSLIIATGRFGDN
ncbi:MAG: hypothetical protein FWC01_02090 [Treponema sp.]|nr:hypothetical protein [Treponema sp.]MCL2237089.1 hypothetical protein [Treponema sp.]